MYAFRKHISMLCNTGGSARINYAKYYVCAYYVVQFIGNLRADLRGGRVMYRCCVDATRVFHNP